MGCALEQVNQLSCLFEMGWPLGRLSVLGNGSAQYHREPGQAVVIWPSFYNQFRLGSGDKHAGPKAVY